MPLPCHDSGHISGCGDPSAAQPSAQCRRICKVLKDQPSAQHAAICTVHRHLHSTQPSAQVLHSQCALLRERRRRLADVVPLIELGRHRGHVLRRGAPATLHLRHSHRSARFVGAGQTPRSADCNCITWLAGCPASACPMAHLFSGTGSSEGRGQAIRKPLLHLHSTHHTESGAAGCFHNLPWIRRKASASKAVVDTGAFCLGSQDPATRTRLQAACVQSLHPQSSIPVARQSPSDSVNSGTLLTIHFLDYIFYFMKTLERCQTPRSALDPASDWAQEAPRRAQLQALLK